MSPTAPRRTKARYSRVFYRTLLRAYPLAFRNAHGDDATDVFADLAHAARLAGGSRLVALWLRSVPMVVRGGMQERRGGPSPPQSPPHRKWSIDMLTSEFLQAARALLRRPVFTATAVLTLALGIGATTAVFSVIDTVLLRPLPYPDSQELVVVSHTAPEIASGDWGLSPAGYFYFRENADTLRDIGVYFRDVAVVTGEGEPERIGSTRISASLLSTLDVAPEIGRPIGSDDDQPGAPLVALLSHGFWTRSFGGDPAVVGRPLLLDGISYEVIGVMPPGFDLPVPGTDVWSALRLDPGARPVNSHYLESIARLREGVTGEQARTQLAGLMGRFPEEMPTAYGGGFMERSGFRVNIRGLLEETVGNVRALLWIVFFAAAFVLVIACANVANLTMLRAEGRRRELAVRGALGASRGALLRFGIAESAIVAVAAGAIGLGLAWVGVRLIVIAAPEGLARVETIAVRPQALGVALGTVLGLTLILGVVSVFQGGSDMAERLRSGGRTGSADRARLRARGAFVITQVAVVLVLMVGSGVLLRSFVKLRSVDPGFTADNVLTMQIPISRVKYSDDGMALRFFEQVGDRLRALPGVTAVGATTALPLVTRPAENLNGVADLPDGSEQNVNIDTRFIGPGYLEALGIRLLEGRTFERRDMDAAEPGAIVSGALAQQLWPGESPIGKRVRPLLRDYPWHRVVGVVGDVREEDITRAPEPTVYFPYTDLSWFRSFTIAMRTEGAPTALLPAVRREVSALDPDVPLASVATMDDLVAGHLSRTTFTLTLVGLATAMALFLCAVGIYGVIGFAVRQRHFEIGVRMALGAQNGQVAGMVIGQTMALALAGIVVGLGLAIAGMGLMESLLYEVTPTDPVTLTAVVLGLGLIALLAGALPALRATRVDAIIALQGE